NFFPSINNWTPYEESLRKLIQKETTTEFADQAIKSFCKTLYINYINEADSLISDEKYSEADLMIKNASTFCNLNPDKQCEILTFNKLAQAKYGIFDAYLQVALSAMEMGKLEFAQNYLRLAMEFQIANSNIIISSTTVEQYYEELAWAYFEAAKDFYNLENFREAFDAYVNARQIYDLIEIDTYDELIDKQIKRCFINN
ncbi:MAG: hypothetical protein K9H16_16205, partial [Bacteroidales bacterium]|nr:hypothetical protein [Bacteroidales bacterium]